MTNFGIEAPHYGIPGSVTQLDASTGAVVQTIGVDGFPPNSISSDGTHVWVTSSDYIGNSVMELDASTGAVVGGIPAISAWAAIPTASPPTVPTPG